MRNLVRSALSVGIFAFTQAAAHAQQPALPQLKYAVVISRHGVRPPLTAPERLNEYSAQPWPDWGVPVGFLTDHGRVLMTMMGGFYRDWFTSQSLPPRSGCGDRSGVYFWSDIDERNVESSRALSKGLLPACEPEIHRVPEGRKDPLFDPIVTGGVKPDVALEMAEVGARLGPDPQAIVSANRAAFDALQRVLQGAGKPARSIFDQPMALTPGKTSVALAGPLGLGATYAEDLLLEYVDGMSGEKLGWGRVDAAGILQIMQLHAAHTELMWRTPALARVRATNLLGALEKSLDQAIQAKAVPGAIGPPSTQILFISAHDTDLAAIGATLNAHWQLPGYQPNDTPPGSAFIFSLWRTAAGQYQVRMRIVSQTMDQMHFATPLSLTAPPPAQELYLPGCGTPAEGNACGWKPFSASLQ